MANAKFIDAATWASLPEIDVTNGEDLFPQLAAGTYRPVLSGVDSAVIPALTAGAIVQATPTVGDTLTVSGSNATGSATFQWQRDTGGGQADISGATSATYDTTGQPEGDYRRGVSDGVQGPVYTAAVTLGAAATVPGTMSAPTVTAVSDTEISVDRAAAPSDGGSAILSYDLRWEVDGSGSWTTVTGITDPQSVTGLTASTLYNVQTRAVNAVDAGAWSASGSATTDAASGLNFVDDFTSYSLGANLYNDVAAYSSPDGYGYVTVQDSGGTRVARAGSPSTIQTYVAQAVADDREVGAILHSTNATVGVVLELHLYYIDANTKCYVGFDTGGWCSFHQIVGGSSVVSQDVNTGAAPVAGDAFKISRTGNDIVVKKNGATIVTKTLSGSPTGGVPGFFMQYGTPTPYREIREFSVKEL